MTGNSLFVIGGARSGKSAYAQSRAEALPGPHIYVATAQAFDDEMRERIAHHRADRDARWTTVEAALDLPDCLARHSGLGATVLVDCLTLWTSNLLLAEHDFTVETDALCAAITAFDGRLILVANEVGYGIVPDNALARRFRDEAGRINQRVAAVSREVVLVAAGLPLTLKPVSTGG